MSAFQNENLDMFAFQFREKTLSGNPTDVLMKNVPGRECNVGNPCCLRGLMLAEAKDNLTVTGCGEGAWEEETAEKEKWGSGVRKGRSERGRGKLENRRTRGVERNVWGGKAGG